MKDQLLKRLKLRRDEGEKVGISRLGSLGNVERLVSHGKVDSIGRIPAIYEQINLVTASELQTNIGRMGPKLQLHAPCMIAVLRYSFYSVHCEWQMTDGRCSRKDSNWYCIVKDPTCSPRRPLCSNF